MGRIGRYETLEEISPGLHVARGPRKGPCVLRLSSPAGEALEAVGPGRLAGPAQVEGRAEAQRRAAGSPYWVPVLDLGTEAGQAYCVYPRCPDAISRYLAFTTVGEDAVWGVLNRVLQGLADYRARANRPHGNLTPGNILLGRTRGAWWETVVLTDPLADAELEADRAWRDDLCAAGELLFRLVLQRPPGRHELPSEDAPWEKVLGAAGPAWRSFCADLLDRSRPMDLDEALHRVAGLKPKVSPGRGARRLLVVLCPVLVVLAAGVWGLARYQALPPGLRDAAIRLRCLAGLRSYDPGAWRRLCDEYHAWLGGFAERAARPQTAAAWRRHPYLERLLALLETARGDLDPVRIGGEAVAYSDLRETVPDRARECGSYDLVLEALAHAEAVRTYLRRADADQGGWDALRVVSGPLAERCAAGRWTATAEHLRGLAKAIVPPDAGSLRAAATPYAGADAIRQVIEWWDAVGEASQDLEARIARLRETGDPILARYGEAVAGELAKGASRSHGTLEDIDQFRGYVAEAAKLADAMERLLAGVWASLGPERQQLWRDEEQRRFGSESNPTLDTYRLWLSELQQFSTDPALDWVMEARKLDAVTGSEVLNAEWRRRRDELIGPDAAPLSELRGDSTRRSRLQRWRYLLSSLDDQSILPLPLPGSAEPAVAAKREATLARVLGLTQGEGTDVNALKGSGPVQDLCNEYRRWRRELPLLAEALAAVEVPIANLYGFGEEPVPGKPAPIRAVFEAWSGQDLWQAPGLPAGLDEARRRVDLLAQVEARQPGQSAEDRAWLRGIALADPVDLPAALAAWRRLGAADWPRGDAERADDESMRQRLARELSVWTAPDPARRTLVEWELQTEAERRAVRDVLEKLDADPDPALRRFVRFYRQTYAETRQAAGDAARLAELTATSALARGLARVVMKPEWPDDYDRASLARELPPPETFDEGFYQEWPGKAEGFRLLRPDPRGDPADWDAAIGRLRASRGVLERFPAELARSAEQLAAIGRLRDDLLARPPIQMHRDAILDARRRLETAIASYEADFAPLVSDRLLPPDQWTRRLEQLSADIEDLAGGSPELRALHARLAEAVKGLLETAPVARNAEAVNAALDRIGALEQEIQNGTDPGTWLDRVGAQGTVSEDALANRVWADLRAESLRGVTAEGLKADRALYRRLRDRLRAVSEFLASRPWGEILPPALPAPAAGLPELAWHEDLPPVLAEERQACLLAAARKAAEAPGEAEAPLARYRAVRRALVEARDELTLADLRFSQWALPREAPGPGAAGTLGDCLRGWSSARPELAELRRRLPRLDAFCGDLFALNDGLEKTLSASADEVAAAMPALLERDAAERQAQADPRSGLARRSASGLMLYAGYLRLGEAGWPRTLAELTRDLDWSDRLLERLPPERSGALAASLAAARRERWGRVYERLTDCAEILHGSMDLLPRIGLDPRQAMETYAGLALHARVNLVVGWLVAQLAAADRPEAALEARSEAARRLTELGTQVKYPDPMFTSIEDRVRALNSLSSRDTDAAVRGVARCGPGRVGWQYSAGPDPSLVTYRGDLGGSGFVLTFRRVRADPEDPARAAFVCTTEVPVGLFVALCARSAGPGGTLIGEQMVLFVSEEVRNPVLDPRRGPRTWEVSLGGDGRLLPAAPPRQWLRETPVFPETMHYPPGGTPPPPGLDHPLQYIPPRAAVFLALSLGCRLPTAFEWQQALQAGPPDARPPSLRDALWRRQYEHILGLPPVRQGLTGLLGGKTEKHWPSADTFPSGGPAGELDRECAPGDDGCLWLREVPGGGRTSVEFFADLAGNVREFVYEDSRQLDRLLDKSPVSREDLRNELTNPRKFAVIGDSALGPPASPEERATPRPIPAQVGGWDCGFSDVGVRLAFTAPDEKLSDTLTSIADSLCITPGGR